jgi:hypothetical protein
VNNQPNEFYGKYLDSEVFIPKGGTYGKDGRADLVDLDTKEIWEIKPVSVIYSNIAEEVRAVET